MRQTMRGPADQTHWSAMVAFVAWSVGSVAKTKAMLGEEKEKDSGDIGRGGDASYHVTLFSIDLTLLWASRRASSTASASKDLHSAI